MSADADRGDSSSDVVEVMRTYNRATGRRFSVKTHDQYIRPRLKEGVTLQAFGLASIGACLSAHHIGLNDRREVYLDPKTIFQAARLDGHAERARRADYRLENGEQVWEYWCRELSLPSQAAVMEHFFRLRDALVAAEGGKPKGPAAAYSSGYQPGDPWPALESLAS